MTKKILLGASFLALMAAYPAFAADEAVTGEVSTQTKMENKMDAAEKSIEKTTEKAGAAVKGAYNDVKAYFDEDSKGAVTTLNVNTRLTADELIGTDVQNPKGETIGQIKDILIDANGKAQTVVISDSSLGLGGKLAAFDFDTIQGFSKDKDVVVKLNEAQIDTAKRFEYIAPSKPDVNVAVLPENEYSVAKIIDSKVVDANGKAVADVDTVAFEGGEADYIVVTFNKILGMGGNKAALNIDALDMAKKDSKYVFTLSQKQTVQFESAKDKTTAN